MLLAAAWCQKLQDLYDIWVADRSLMFVYTADDLRAAEVPQSTLAEIERSKTRSTQHAVDEYLEAIHKVRVSRPVS